MTFWRKVLIASSFWLAGFPFAQATEPVVEIDRIELVGVTVFDGKTVEPILELTAGDRLEHRKVVRTAENLQELYRNHGYEQVQVKTELSQQRGDQGQPETVLKFSIVEGLPTRISRVRLVPSWIITERLALADNTHAEFKNYWKVNETDLLATIGLKQGDLFDQDQVSTGKRSLQDALAAEEFIGAKVDDPQITQVAVPEGQTSPAAKWIELEFHVDLGDRITFGFRGNTVFTKSNLLSWVDDQRAIGFTKGYVESIRKRIEDEYRLAGYDRVQVTPFTFEKAQKKERHITFEIIEGPKIEIEDVEFDGNVAFTDERLQEYFYEQGSPQIQRGYYVEKEVEKSTELLLEWMKSQGYLGAKLVTISRTYNEKKHSVRLLVYLYEGDQTLVRDLKLKGAAAISPDEVKRILRIQEASPLNLFAFSEGIETLKAAYRARGYLDARILNEGVAEGGSAVILYSQENRVADIYLELDEGPQFKVNRIAIEGLSKTKEDVVRRELLFREDDILESYRVTESEARLRKLGIFSVVTVRAENDLDKAGYKNVKISIQEGTPGIIAGGIGIRNDLGARVFGQTAYTNLWKRNHTVSLNANLNRRFDEDFCANPAQRLAGEKGDLCFVEYQFQLGYVWPWFMLGATTFRPKFTVEKTQFRQFDASSVELAGTWERRLLKSIDLSGLFTYSIERIRQFHADTNVDNQTLRIGAITPGLRLDLRDSSLAPTTGWYSSTSFEYASTWLLSQKDPVPLGYSRFQYRLDRYIPLFKNVTWFLSFRTGFEKNLEVQTDGGPEDLRYSIPLIKQFALGGAGSMRGFKEQELNFQDKAIRGTMSYVNYRTQIDLPFAGPLRFAPFLDAANLMLDTYTFGHLRYGAGVGLHYQSPVGPVNFDWGFKLDPRAGEDPSRFYFTIGVI